MLSLRPFTLFGSAGAFLLITCEAVLALPNFFGAAPVAQSAVAGFSNDVSIDVATDGSGTWLVVWTTEAAIGGGRYGSPRLVFARSTDSGASWSSPANIAPSSQNDTAVAVAYGGGTFIVMWVRDLVPMVARSPDGLTWSTPTPIGTSVAFRSDHGIDLETDGAGTWVAVWATDVGWLAPAGFVGPDSDLAFARSLDNGVSWSGEAVANPDATRDDPGSGSSIDNSDEDRPTLATDGAGNWVLAWSRNRELTKVMAVSSADNGASWNSLSELRSGWSSTGGPNFFGGRYVATATDRSGTWIVDWLDGCAKSFDAGATWSLMGGPACPFGNLWRDDEVLAGRDRVLAAGIDGEWLSLAAYGDPVTLDGSVGRDSDILISRSVNGGVSWTLPAALGGAAVGTDGSDWLPALAVDPSGNYLAAWASSGGDLVAARAVPICTPDPQSNCAVLRSADRQEIKWASRGGRRDSLKLVLSSAELVPSDFGDPTTTTGIGLCVYDRLGGTSSLVYESHLPASATCGKKPCWAGASGRFRYSDRKATQSAIVRAKLKTRSSGGGRVLFKGRGPTLAPPRLPLAADPDITVQVVTSDTRSCLEAHFSRVSTASVERFEAK